MPIYKNKYFIFSVLIFLTTAIFSSGFLHPDEHYQILELLHLKNSNWTMPEIFNWDFNDKIRPWFQTSLYYIILKIFPIDDPFVQSTFFRILNGALALFSIYKVSKQFVTQGRLKYLFYVSMMWFIPFLLVRTNSESLSISLFLIGMTYFNDEKQYKKSFLSGLFFGASFLARYQMGIPVFCINLLILIKTKDLKRFAIHSLAILVMILVGIVIDIWGYGVFNISPWNYFRENIINSRASEFGTSSFFYYFYMPIFKGGIIIPILIWIGVYKYHREKKLDVWIVAFWSFFLIHSYIPHKEIRFISFNYILGTLMAVKYIDHISNKKVKISLFLLNSLFLLRTSFFPANSYVNLYKTAYNLNIKSINVISENGGSGFKFMMPYYQKRRIETLPIKIEEFERGYILGENYSQYMLVKKRENCENLFKSYPEEIKYLNISNWLSRSSFFSIWKCL